MLIYFSASARNLEADLPNYKRIVSIIHSLGHTVSHDWIEPARLRMKRDGYNFGNLDVVVRDAEAAIESAEVLIAEATGGSTFGVGYEVALALSKRKPVLVLLNKHSKRDSYAIGITNSLLTTKNYDAGNLEKCVEDFIKANTIKIKDLRFNFVIDRQIYNHLRFRSYQTGKTKAEILRDLLLHDIQDDNK